MLARLAWPVVVETIPDRSAEMPTLGENVEVSDISIGFIRKRMSEHIDVVFNTRRSNAHRV